MKIVIDIQGAQTESRFRGIGRYSLALAQAMARRPCGHDIWLAVSGLLPDTVEYVRAAFDGLIAQERIVVWYAPGPVAENVAQNSWRREAGERMREAFLANLKPDVVHISSLFEGFANDALTSVGALESTLYTAVTLYDLIPLIYRDHYLAKPATEAWYERKLSSLQRAHLWLAISESSRREGIEVANLAEEWTVNVSTAADAMFRPVSVGSDERQALIHRYGLTRPFVMYTGGIDPRKNIEGLIRAYATLPSATRAAYQLAIVCFANDDQISPLRHLAARCGLAHDDIVFTGFVPDADMVLLYNLCTLFVFPSWHEGFGLPALEAMSCGAAVIGSNTSSVPEVIGRTDALFDPYDEIAMGNKLHAVLTDHAFRSELKCHGLAQSKKFSWANTARRALGAFERLHYRNVADNGGRINLIASPRPRLAYVSPLPPQESGIADYSADVVPELAKYYDIDVVVDQPEIGVPWIRANCHIRSAEWFHEHGHQYKRILYHFGNSPFHMHMFKMLERFPGTVVLHDFFLSGVIAHMEWLGYAPGAWSTALYASHGYHALEQQLTSQEKGDVVWRYPANLAVLQTANGVIAHSRMSADLIDQWYGRGQSADWAIIPLPHKRAPAAGRARARASLGLNDEDFLVCSFGMLGSTKLNHRLLGAWLAAPLARNDRCHLVFVGENDAGEYGAELLALIARSAASERIVITGYTPPALYRNYLTAADAAVQLRGQSRGETSRALLDCMAQGVPAIVNAHGTSAELPPSCIFQLPDEFSETDLQEALMQLWHDAGLRCRLGLSAAAHVGDRHNPREVVRQYRDSIERFACSGPHARTAKVLQAVAALNMPPNDSSEWLAVARAITMNQAPTIGLKQLLVDTSVLVQHDAGSGIQRVVRHILRELLMMPLAGYRVEPVYLSSDGVYRYARRFTLDLLECANAGLADEAIAVGRNDVFLGLDFTSHLLPRFAKHFSELRDRGTRIYFVIYDLLPVLNPDWFPHGTRRWFVPWLETLGMLADGAICISRVVADELTHWLEGTQIARQRPFKIGWFHLGADIGAHPTSDCGSLNFDSVLHHVRTRQSVLMVGTVEPRKGYAQALSAFESLWDRGVDCNLVIVGKPGWQVDGLINRMRKHRRAGRRLFWLESASDELLSELYQAVDGLLMASEGEGFGLPLVEAALHKRPILARDIPVFREIAGEHASYFAGVATDSLATTLDTWLRALAEKRAQESGSMPRLTWRESARQLTEVVLAGKWDRQWQPGHVAAAFTANESTHS